MFPRFKKYRLVNHRYLPSHGPLILVILINANHHPHKSSHSYTVQAYKTVLNHLYILYVRPVMSGDGCNIYRDSTILEPCAGIRDSRDLATESSPSTGSKFKLVIKTSGCFSNCHVEYWERARRDERVKSRMNERG
jgi:hypothetical protein